jgi:hypothetical protein|tara:strand:- start:20651 stop:21358 length:708 start_codon:yes stop_codon:yes gene_type:complete
MDWRIVPTEKQSAHLKKPWTFSVAALKSADFLARQDYIDWWIKEWLRQTLVAPDELPLCVAESIHCDRKLRRRLARSIKNAIVRGDVQYFKTHNLIPDAIVWNFVDFDTVSEDMFMTLVATTPVPRRLSPFVVAARRLSILEHFVDKHGATLPLRDCICHQWLPAVRWLLEEGAEIEDDCVGMAVRHAEIFRLVTLYNPPAKQTDWKEFLLQFTLKRVPDVPLVEEWFWINGFKI